MANTASILGDLAVPQVFCVEGAISHILPQKGLLRGGTQSSGRFGCPIEFEQFAQMPSAPQDGSDDGEEAGKAVLPGMLECEITHQQVSQQAGPDLPLHRIGIMAEEVGQLNGLLDLLEKHLDIPSAPVKFRHGPGTPLHVIGQEFHLAILPIHLNQGDHPAQGFGIGLVGSIRGQFNDLIAQDPRIVGGVQGFDYATCQVVLRAADPEDAFTIHVRKVVEVHIGLVKHHDFAGLKPGTQVSRLGIVVEFGRIDDDALRKKALKIQPDVALGRRFPPPVFRPVHALGHQLDGGRVHGVYRRAEAAQIPPADLTLGKLRTHCHQMLHDLPVQRLGHRSASLAVGITQRIFRRGRRSPNRSQRAGVHSQPVTHIIQADRMGQMSVDQAHQMTPWRKPATLFINPIQLSQPLHQVRRNQVAYLPQNRVRKPCWTERSLFFHPYRVAGFNASVQHFFQTPMKPMGLQCITILNGTPP